MNIFQLYVGQIHLFSLVSAGVVTIMGMYLTRRYPIHISTVMSLITVVLGHYIYEDIFIQIMGLTGRGTEAWMLYILITIAIMLGMYILQKRYSFLHLHRGGLIFSIFLCTELVLLFTVMWMGGWFNALQLWYSGCCPDPHDGIWAFSKLVGLALFVPLLWRDKKSL